MKFAIGDQLLCDGWGQVTGDPPFDEPQVDTFTVEVIGIEDGRYRALDADGDEWLMQEEYLRPL
jgi:hypothetical protein